MTKHIRRPDPICAIIGNMPAGYELPSVFGEIGITWDPMDTYSSFASLLENGKNEDYKLIIVHHHAGDLIIPDSIRQTRAQWKTCKIIFISNEVAFKQPTKIAGADAFVEINTDFVDSLKACLKKLRLIKIVSQS
jgi:hypothetical protein